MRGDSPWQGCPLLAPKTPDAGWRLGGQGPLSGESYAWMADLSGSS